MRMFRYQVGGEWKGAPLTRISQIRRPSDTPLILDGLRLLDGKTARMSARHNRRTMTNMLFADGHCQSVNEKALPNDDKVFAGTDPNAVTRRWGSVRWRMDQR